MTEPKFLQIHFLTPYSSALLNRDDSGLAKRLPFGGVMRTRVSSQCLKRHWRIADDPHALSRIDGADAAFRSREIVARKVFADVGMLDENDLNVLKQAFNKAVYGDKGDTKKSRQTLLLGEVEIAFLKGEAERLVNEIKAGSNAEESAAAWLKEHKANFKAMSEGAALPAGLSGALFGRMVTSDPEANITAPVHVAHAFTVHEEEAESDYFVAVDDLSQEDESGADTIQETELTSGVFYGYVVVDLPGLVANLGGDRDMASEVLHNLVHLIAEVSPGAKLGSTAPYSRASMILLEAGDRQPRSLADAYRVPCAADTKKAVVALAEHLEAVDAAYATGEERRFMSLADSKMPGAECGSLAELADWAAELPGRLG